MHNNLGDLWRAQGQLGRQEAQRCYQEALRLDNSYAPAWRGLGDVFRENADHSNAVSCYQVLLALHKVRLDSAQITTFSGPQAVILE